MRVVVEAEVGVRDGGDAEGLVGVVEEGHSLAAGHRLAGLVVTEHSVGNYYNMCRYVRAYQHPQYLLRKSREVRTPAFHILGLLWLAIAPAALGKRVTLRENNRKITKAT